MADSVTAANLPPGFDLYAGYVDGAYKNLAAIEAMYPLRTLGIAVFSTTNAGIIGDCENGDMTPQTLVDWVVLRRGAGVDPTGYTSEANWQACKDAFAARGIPEPHWWIAGYPGSVGEALYPGSIAHQWIDRGPYDESVVADYWPGVDPAPAPPAPPPPAPVPTPTPPPAPDPPAEDSDDMAVIEHNGQRHVFGVITTTTTVTTHDATTVTETSVPYHWYQSIDGPDFSWISEKLPV